ncbi:hypothetical protein OIU79_002983 [Salix purpurea]|uniref:Uncharacterized protein n=1 Tax=Salix purpurea TaxID=77065 RepID=A0A9Q0UKF1_SALPP|nr:hypothetical protein OIU79_002983 [Salix purpurea]
MKTTGSDAMRKSMCGRKIHPLFYEMSARSSMSTKVILLGNLGGNLKYMASSMLIGR